MESGGDGKMKGKIRKSSERKLFSWNHLQDL